MKIELLYRKDLDECCVYNRETSESIVYIQGYSSKYPMPESETPTMEQLVQMAVRYPEIENAI